MAKQASQSAKAKGHHAARRALVLSGFGHFEALADAYSLQ